MDIMWNQHIKSRGNPGAQVVFYRHVPGVVLALQQPPVQQRDDQV